MLQVITILNIDSRNFVLLLQAKIGQRIKLSKEDAKQMNKKYQKECKKRG